MKRYLLLPHIRVHNANAMSSAYTVGFPAMTAWLGAVHALERKVKAVGYDISLAKMGVSCHSCEPQLYRGKGDRRTSIVGTANPLRKKGAEFVRPPFIEEARVHLVVSLLIELDADSELLYDEQEEILAKIKDLLQTLKIAGGDIELSADFKPQLLTRDEKDMRQLYAELMPGYVLISRRDLLLAGNPEDSLTALLDVLAVTAQQQADGTWHYQRTLPGWIVPIVVGFEDLTGTVSVSNSRDQDYEHHFVEPLVTLGEFVLPYRCSSVDDMMWHYVYQKETGRYLCVNEQEIREEL